MRVLSVPNKITTSNYLDSLNIECFAYKPMQPRETPKLLSRVGGFAGLDHAYVCAMLH